MQTITAPHHTAPHHIPTSHDRRPAAGASPRVCPVPRSAGSPARTAARAGGGARAGAAAVTGREVGTRRIANRPAAQRRPVDRRPAAPAPVGTRCGGGAAARAAHLRRRATAAAVLVGIGLAMLVWVIGTVGANYQEASTPSPTRTEVVHVRAGESLTAIAERVAPDVPREVVIADIVDLNQMSGSGLRVGQPLLAPAYR
ncbi:hypothetical protein GCM10009624_09970 [Gordonia sinesedis]